MPTARTSWFVDTNILVYALDPNEPGKRAAAGALLRRHMARQTLVLSQQSLNEFYRVVTDRSKMMPRPEARRFVRGLMPYASAPLDSGTMTTAWRIQDEEGFGWWDSLLLASALRAGCSHFASEDLQDGRTIGTILITNPFDAASAAN